MFLTRVILYIFTHTALVSLCLISRFLVAEIIFLTFFIIYVISLYYIFSNLLNSTEKLIELFYSILLIFYSLKTANRHIILEVSMSFSKVHVNTFFWNYVVDIIIKTSFFITVFKVFVMLKFSYIVASNFSGRFS